jgi:hypothetical protein
VGFDRDNTCTAIQSTLFAGGNVPAVKREAEEDWRYCSGLRASGGRHSGQRQLTPLVGRDDEMARLIRRWERARQGDGQLVTSVYSRAVTTANDGKVGATQVMRVLARR